MEKIIWNTFNLKNGQYGPSRNAQTAIRNGDLELLRKGISMNINESSNVEAEVTEEILPSGLKENNKGLRPESLGTPTSRKPRKRGDRKESGTRLLETCENPEEAGFQEEVLTVCIAINW